MSQTIALEIDSPESWEFLCALEPHFAELDYQENLGSFLVTDFEGTRWVIMTPSTIAEKFDHLEPRKPLFKFVNLVD